MANGAVNTQFARSRDELDQPSFSARAFEPLTAILFLEAGLEPGMRVLDAFSATGDVAFLAGAIVGPEGRVIGFEQSAAAVAYANERVAVRRLDNVSFIEADVTSLPFAAEFDAVIGRVVLMYRRDPESDMKALVRCLRPGGLAIFQELDMLAGRTEPPAPVVEQVRDWLLDAFQRVGIHMNMGPELYPVFKAAGLDPPRMRIDGFIGGKESISPLLIANVARMLLPQLEAMGITTADEMQIDTLEQRMRADLERTGGIMSTPMLIGAWARLPA